LSLHNAYVQARSYNTHQVVFCGSLELPGVAIFDTRNDMGAAFQKYKNGGLNFRALLMGNGTQRVELARA
jgi:hypothetical protein